MPDPVIVVDPGPVSNSRKLLTALLTAAATFMLAVNIPGSDIGEAAVTVVPLGIGAIVVYFTANTPSAPSSKFLVAFGAADVTLIVYLIQHGTEDWRAAGLTFATAVVGAVITWLTPNANQQFVDAVHP